MNIKIYTLIFFLLFFQLTKIVAQFQTHEEPKRLYFDRTRRITNFWEMKDMRDVTHKDKLLMGKNRISGNISYNTGRILIADGQKKQEEIRSALGYFIRVRFFEEFSFNATFYQDFNSRASAKWTANYTYSLARYAWKPNSFNFGYENYVNNRYSDKIKTMGDKFLEGYYFLSYSNNFTKLEKKIKLDTTSNIKISYLIRYSIKYVDNNEVLHGGIVSGKTTLAVGFHYVIFKNIYFESAIYYYLEEKIKKQPWDPDYTYGFGYFDWRSFRLTATYGNWAVNQFPWHKNYYPNYDFWDGNFKISASWIW